MTYFEDSASPATPFSGDGSIFDHPDVLLQAPTTNERVVDTQSGFLVVIKRLGERVALSCKRRVGTPPSSNILLTPDESLKLSKILASSIGGMDYAGESQPSLRANQAGRRRFAFAPQASSKRGLSLRSGMAKPAIILGASALALALIVAGYSWGTHAPRIDAGIADIDPLSATKVEKFARLFVADILDFNPSTYKVSQIQAMSYMSPELLEKYWKETNFPLTRRQLKSLPQGTTVLINRVSEEKSGDNSADVNIYASLVRSQSKLNTAIHIKLKLGLDASGDGGIRVLEQEDLTSASAAHE